MHAVLSGQFDLDFRLLQEPLDHLGLEGQWI